MSGDHNQYQKDQFPGTTKMMREWVSLSKDEIYAIAENDEIDWPVGGTVTFARLIEAKLKEKNAYGWQSVSNPTEYLDELRGGEDT